VPLPGEQLPPADKDAAGDDRYRFFATVEGASPQYPDVRGHHPAQGRFPDAADNAARARVCALGSDLPMKLFGRPDVLGREIELRGERFRIVGIMQEKGFVGFESFDKRIFIPLATAREIYGLPGSHDILIRAREDVDLKQAQAAATAALRKAAGLAQGEPADFTITTVAELTGPVNSTLVVFRVMLYGISSVALLVAGIGIMNVMLMQVIERTREIGVRRAVGARRRDILAQFLAEAVAQTLIGVVLGVGLGVAAALGFCWVVHWKPFIRPDTILLATIFSVGVGLLFGVYPAFHAALLKPIDCLRYE
jgi:putative ABC transport system permease protein